jgi:hypothetical protein
VRTADPDRRRRLRWRPGRPARRRKSFHLVRAYQDRVDRHSRARHALGFLVLADARWQLHLIGSGSTLVWGPLGPTVHIRRRRLWSSEVALQSVNGRYRAVFRLPFTSARRLQRLVARRRAVAEQSLDRRNRIRSGEWWHDHSVFAGTGLARAISIADVVYLGGWSGPVRRYKSARRRVLDLTPDGIVMRGFRRNLHVPWSDVVGLDVLPATEGATTIRVRVTSGEEARFGTAAFSPDELARILRPVRLALTSDRA